MRKGRECRGRNKRDKRNEQRHTRVHTQKTGGAVKRSEKKESENAVEERAVSLWSFRAPLQNPACICMVEDE